MTFLPSALTAVTHDHWFENVLIENTLDDTPELQDHLKCLADTLHDNLVAALALERHFGERNDKTMYIAPFIRSVIHTAVTGVEIQHVSSYPVAIDPCFVGDPLLRLLSHYGHATDIICANIPAPVTYEEDGDGITSERSSSDDDALDEANDYDMESVHEEEAKSESERTIRRWLAGHYMTKKAEDQAASTDFYHNQHSSTSSEHPPAGPDHSLLAQLTTDSSSDSTPLALICVAKAREIYAAMTSCLYQRLAWGIHEPLTGIVLDNTTCNVRILFGRFQNSDSEDSDCSTVHISESEKGCYDLFDDASALEFASFLSKLCRRKPTMYETAIAFTSQLEDDIAGCRLRLWRLDQAVLVVPEEGPSLAEQITRWLDSINAFSYVDDQPPCVAASSSSNVAGSDVLSAKETRAPSLVGAPSESHESMHFRTISATELAAGGKHEDKTILMSFWMLARMAIPRTLMFPLMLLDEKYKLNGMFGTINMEYYELVSFSWISKLGNLNKKLRNLPLVKTAQATATLMMSKSSTHTDQWMPYKALSAPCEKILCDNLWEIASVLEDVQRINGNGKTQASELECRHSLDRLMLRFFHGGSTEKLSQEEYSNTAHVMVSLERSLMLPTGTLVDAYTTCDMTDQIVLMSSVESRINDLSLSDFLQISNFVKATSLEISMTVPHARNAPDPASAPSLHSDRALRTFSEDVQAVRKSTVAAIDRNKIGRIGVVAVKEGKENPMLQPYADEPSKAVCDSVGYIRIPKVFTSIPASSSFNIIQSRHASPSPSKSIPKQSMPSDSDSGTGNGTSLARRQQMGRDFEMDNPDDLFAVSQSFSVSMDPSRIEQPVPLPVASKHSLNMSVLTGGELEDNDDTEKMAELDVRRDLFLPIISSEHKKVLGVFFATNVNQGRMYATASVKFYVALGIYNLGVYTIVSEGSVLVVTVSYAEKPDDEDGVPIVHILERNAISFDISEPLGILNFATFLIKLRVEYVPKVWARVYSVIGDSPVEIRKYLKTLNIPTGGDKNQAAWRKHKPQNI